MLKTTFKIRRRIKYKSAFSRKRSKLRRRESKGKTPKKRHCQEKEYFQSDTKKINNFC